MLNGVGSDVRALMKFEAQKKSVGVAYLLWIFLGGAGGHRFYTGRVLSGIAMFLLLCFSIAAAGVPLIFLGLWALVDAFLIPGWVRRYNTSLIDALAQVSSPQSAVAGTAKMRPESARQDDAFTQKMSAKTIVGIVLGIAGIFALAQLPQQPVNPPSGTTEFYATVTPKLGEAQAVSSAPVQVSQATWTTNVRAEPKSPSDKNAPIVVPTDSNANYYVERVAKTKRGFVRIVSRREGLSGTTYSGRECNCSKKTFRSLGDGESLEELSTRQPDTHFSKLVFGNDGLGSISYHVCEHGCSAVMRRASAQ